MECFVVGNIDCQYIDVCDTIEKSPSAAALYQKWKDFARRLKIPEVQILQLETQLGKPGYTFNSIIYEILMCWRGAASNNANLSNLIITFESCNLVEIAYSFRHKFKLQSKNGKKFEHLPTSFINFIDSTCMILVLSTSSPNVTYKNLLENSQLVISDLKSEESFISRKKLTPGVMITAILSEDVSKFLKKHKKFKTKLLLLTKESESNLKKRLKNLNQLQISSDTIKWEDLTAAFRSEILSNCDLLKSGDKFLGDILTSDQLFEVIEDPTTLTIRHTLPSSIKYYISRKIISRHAISEEIFEAPTSSNVYVFTGMQRHELSICAKDNLTDVSTNQIELDKISVSFILLDVKTDFDVITKKTEKSVHWLHRENGKLIWVRSSGSLKDIQKYTNSTQDVYSEEEFLAHVGTEIDSKALPVCISDTPGMGKSILLANIGRKLLSANKTVVFIVIGEFIDFILSKVFASKPSIDNVSDAICEQACNSHTGKQIFKKMLLDKNFQIELLFDGLDEAPYKHLPLIYEYFLLAIHLLPSVRLWITTRPHILQQVEEKLNILGYNIAPFDSDDQINFLVSFWSQQHTLLEKNCLNSFGKKCLEVLNNIGHSNYDDGDDDNHNEGIAGIPLQCFLIAKVYENQAIRYSTIGNIVSDDCLPSVPIDSVASLYESMVSSCFLKYFTNYYACGSNITSEDLKNVHALLALELLFPDWKTKLEHHFQFDNTLDWAEVVKVGILESTSTELVPRFIHRTFAEYFVAWFTYNMLRSECNVVEYSFFNDEILKNTSFIHYLCEHTRNSLFEKTAVKFDQYVVCYFLDYQIDAGLEIKCKNLTLHNDSVKKISLACVYHNSFRLFKALYNTNAFQLLREQIFDQNTLVMLINFSSLPFVEFAVKEFRDIGEIDLDEISQNTDDDDNINLLHIAAARGDFGIFEYLLKQHNFIKWVRESQKTLLAHICVENSSYHSSKIIKDKLQIIRALHSIKETVIEERDDQNNTALLCESVHIDLLDELLTLNAHLFALDEDGDSVLHKAPHFFHHFSDFEKLVQAIPTCALKTLLVMKGRTGRTPLHSICSFAFAEKHILELFGRLGADFNNVDDEGQSVISSAIRNDNFSNFDVFITYHADLCHIENENNSLIHVAAHSLNLEALKFLVAQNIFVDMNPRNDYGETPLHLAVKFGFIRGKDNIAGVIHFLVKHGANVNAQNHLCETVLEYSIKSSRCDAVQALYELNLNNETRADITNIYLAAEKSSLEVFKFLCEQKEFAEGDVAIENLHFQNNTLLHAALKNLHHSSKIVQYLFETHKFSERLHILEMRNILHILVKKCELSIKKIMQNKLETLQIILKHDSSLLHELDSESRTPLLAYPGKDLEFMICMIDKGVCVNHADKDGNTFKDMAVKRLRDMDYKKIMSYLEKNHNRYQESTTVVDCRKIQII